MRHPIPGPRKRRIMDTKTCNQRRDAMLPTEARSQIADAAARRSVDPAALEAVITVESGGRIFARVDGREEPLIRWEGHYFDRLCDPSVRAKARGEGLASPNPGAIANPPTQAARWALLTRAAALDHDAAYQSASWGVGQVMGAHWQALGYTNVDALVAEARSGFAGQLKLMLRFIAHAGLLDALKEKDWPAFARHYNGPSFARNRYAEKLCAAYEMCSGNPATEGEPLLSFGSRGAAVLQLQRQLIRDGFAISADGVFGPETDAAVSAFQHRHGLPPDGIVGPRTRAALSAASAKPEPWRWGRLLGLFRAVLRLVGAVGKL
jgi:hypothetical protein